jgi:hypothetical protein
MSKDRSRQRRPRPSRARVSRARVEYCICKGPDDGRPMIHCSQCDDWFHFACTQLQEHDAEDIGKSSLSPAVRPRSCLARFADVYVCPPCHESTGLSSVRECCLFSTPRARRPDILYIPCRALDILFVPELEPCDLYEPCVASCLLRPRCAAPTAWPACV